MLRKAYGCQRGRRDKALACGKNGLVSANGQFESEASTTSPAGSRYESKSYGGCGGSKHASTEDGDPASAACTGSSQGEVKAATATKDQQGTATQHDIRQRADSYST